MIAKKLRILSWNVRGLGNDEKCGVVRNIIRKTRCDVVALQETKGNRVDFTYVSRFLPSYFSYDVVFNLANGSKGGTLIAWTRSFTLVSSWSTYHTVSVMLKHSFTGNVFIITNAYGPAEDGEKRAFIKELRQIATLINRPWALMGDFNLIRWLVDRSTGARCFDLMELFNEFISDFALMDVPVQNRNFTWTNKRPQPTMSKLDRVFMSTDWSTKYPIITLEALEIIISDHAPLVLTCKGIQQRKRRFQLEPFWFGYRTPRAIIQRLWDVEGASHRELGAIGGFHQRTQLLHRALKLWQAETFGALEKELDFCKNAILFLIKLRRKGTCTTMNSS